jgi:Helix-turn-helix domain
MAKAKSREPKERKPRGPREPLTAAVIAEAERLPLKPGAGFIGPDFSPHTLRSYARQGKVSYVKIGRRIFFEKADLLALIQRSRVEAR